jgi:hypothetical protein
MILMNKIAVSLAIVGLVAGAHASDELRKSMNKDNAKMARLMKKLDWKGVEKHLKATTTKDFVYKEAGQSMDLKTMIAQMKSGMSMFKKVTKVETKVLTVQQQGDKANVTATHFIEGTMVGPNKKTQTFRMLGNTIESYVKQNGKWLIKVMDWKDSNMTVDGKPFDPMAAAPAPKKKG